jgi:sugar-specific transcriptional regulator TrmB
LSLERIIKILEGFGLKRTDAEVYIYLAKKGPLKAEKVAIALKLSRNKLHRSLKSLQNKGVITAIPEHPASYSAIAFEKALDLLVETNIEQAKAIKETKETLLSDWREKTKRDNN